MKTNYSLGIKHKAIGMIENGIPLVQVSKTLGMTVQTLRLWKRKVKNGESLEEKPRSGRPSAMTRVGKIIVSKSLNKRGQSTRKLAAKLTRSGNPVSKSTVHLYLRRSLGVRPYKPRRIPLLTKKQVKDRINWCKKRRHWSIDDWRKVIFSDESSFELFHPKNRQNDRVWARNKENVPMSSSVKFPQKIMVWGGMSFQALTELHFVPPKQSVTAAYYIEEILENTLVPALNRTRNTGTILQRKMMRNMSAAIFCQDGAPPHRAKRTQEWLERNVSSFWRKEEWPGNSPDLNPIENL